ncbi:MAG TPA: DUF2461 domain-containing protein [Bacteroidota bacterium]|nr:DUF2461 domain-containing protein [Bacteroidota bacterium]
MALPDFDVEFFPPFEGFPKEGIRFLKRLKRNNNRPWFAKHKHEYETHVKLPMQSLIASMQPHFVNFAPEYEFHPRKSLFRIYRDTRFSKDKTPYKTHVAAHAVLKGDKKGLGASGYYMHIEPGMVYAGAGIYMPESEQLKKIRRAIADRSDEFLSIVEAKPFTRLFRELETKDERLKRVPQGFSPDHPMAEWLRYKHYFVGVTWPESVCYKADLMKELLKVFQTATPLVRFLNGALWGK